MTAQQFIILVIVIVFSSCKSQKDNSITIDIYKTEMTNNLYDIICHCNSVTNISLHQHPIDTNSLSPLEQIELTSGVSKSHYCSIGSNPILGRFANVYQEYRKDTGWIYKFCSSVFFGTADCNDTSKINNWLASKDCFTNNQNFTYKWLTDSSNHDEATLIGLKDNKPVLTFKYADLDSVKLTPIRGLLELLDLFTTKKAGLSSYSLDITLKKPALNSVRTQITADSSSGYLAIIQSKTYKYFYAIDREKIEKTNALNNISNIDAKDADEFIDKFGTDVTRLK